MDLKEFWPQKDAPSLKNAKQFVDKYKGKKIVLKYGGQVMASDQLSKAFAQDAAICNLIGIKNLVIHGGGPQIKKKLENLERPTGVNFIPEFLKFHKNRS